MEGGSNAFGDVDGDETVGGKKVVLTTLVDEAEVARSGGVVVGQRTVDLVQLERDRVVAAIDANDVL